MIDVHLHSRFSFDSEEAPENYIKRAVASGIGVIGFSEHYDFDARLDGEALALADIPAYLKNINKLKTLFGDTEILAGIEFGYRKEAEAEYRAILQKYPLDYVINSLHTLPGRGDCYHDGFFENKSLKQSYYDYFNGVLESISADYDYQIIGHLGYVCRYRSGDGAKIRYSDYADILDEILKQIIKRDKCLEINTSAGVGGCTYLPDADIIGRYLELGGKLLSFGSDAHSAEKYLNKAEQLKQFLKQTGVRELYYYKDRRPVAYKI